MLLSKILPTFVVFFAVSTLQAQSSLVLDDCSLTSKILASERKYAIYLPPGYETSQRSYPALYLLHGAGDDQTGWVQFGEVQHLADQAIRSGQATPMIIVMPDANTGIRGYFNQIDGQWSYEDFFFAELIPHVESKYRIKREKQYRAVAGLSMGGGGSYLYALHRPDMFSSACPLSASARSLTLAEFNARITKKNTALLEGLTEEEIKTYYHQHNILKLMEQMPEQQKRAIRWYIDCGDDDFLYEGNSLVHIAMRKNEIPHEFRIRDGGHNWTYWRESLPQVLKFVSEAFHQK